MRHVQAYFMKGKQMELDRIILKRCPTKPYEVIAFMPDSDANPGRIVSYMHIGQHSEASYQFYLACKPVKANDTEAEAMVRELEQIGYRPRIVKRMSHK